MRNKIPIITPILNALKQAWLAQKILVNPFISYLFFLKPSMLGKDFACKFRLKNLIIYSRWIDWVGLDEVIINKEYDYVLATIKDIRNPTIIDLGANIGAFSIRSFYFNKSAQVYSIEPSLATWQVLEKNRLSNPFLHWKTFRYAVWNQYGEVGFEDNLSASTGSFLNQSKKEVTVPSIRLEDFFEKHIMYPINIVKMDIEGAEEAVLFDSQHLLEKVDTLIVEIHPYRCDEAKIRELLIDNFAYIHEVPNRRSSKPLLFCSKFEIITN